MNIGSLNNYKIKQLCLDYSNLELKFLCFAETWSSDDVISTFVLDGYVLGASYCRTGRGGGVAIYHESMLDVESVDLDGFCVDH